MKSERFALHLSPLTFHLSPLTFSSLLDKRKTLDQRQQMTNLARQTAWTIFCIDPKIFPIYHMRKFTKVKNDLPLT